MGMLTHFEAMKTLRATVKISHHGQFECHVNTCPPKSLWLSVVLSATSSDCCFVFSGTCNVAVNLSTREERAPFAGNVTFVASSQPAPAKVLYLDSTAIFFARYR